MRRSAIAAVTVACGALAAAAPAHGAIPGSLKSSCQRADAADGNVANGVALPYYRCDDGIPSGGGRTATPGASNAVAVPQSYRGFAGLPAKAPAQAGTGADANGDIAIDVDVSLPDPGRFPPPAGGYPLVTFMHGCCAGDKTGWEASTIEGPSEKWHFSNAWFASRGYVVLTYTSRGFVNSQGRGSTGEAQLDSRRFEINDFQHLAGQLADTSFTVAGRTVTVDPRRVIATGGSYGGGFSWMALTDPTWRSPAGKAMRLVAVAPRYGWTNLVQSLVPNGAEMRDRLPSTDLEAARHPLGFPKRTITTGLYASGRTGVPPGSAHTTFPAAIDEAQTCLQAPLPAASNPLCAGTIQTLLPEFLADRSAYFQNEFFDRIRQDRAARVPVFSAGTFTDPLFPPSEHRRMAERLKATVRGYPIQEYYGDYQHFVQNKPKEWADLCGADHHPCRRGDSAPSRIGIHSRLNRFIDHYARPQANPDQPAPSFDVTAGLQICPANAGGGFPLDQPGERFTAGSFGSLAPDSLRLTAAGSKTTANDASPNPHALSADPVANSATNGGRCPRDTGPAGPGVAVYDFPPLGSDAVMIGRARLTVPHTGSGSELQLNARMYEVFPDGSQSMVDRGVKTLGDATGTAVIDLHGNGWRFTKGNRIRVEVAQDDDPFVKASTTPSALTLAGVTLDLPVRRQGPEAAVEAPRLASDVSRSRRFAVAAGARSGELTGVTARELRVRRGARRRALAPTTTSFRGVPGRTYRFSARLRDRRGVPGPWTREAVTVVPLDDRSRRLRFRGFRRIRSSRAWGRTLRRAGRRGATLRMRFRGDRLYIVARTSRRGGVARLVVNGRRRTVRFRSRRTRNRRVVATVRIRRRGVSSLRLTVVRGRVDIDGVGFRR